MKNSPLQLGSIRYSDVVVRAVPGVDLNAVAGALPVQVESEIYYDSDGEHYAVVTVSQKNEAFPYLLEVSAFTTFTIDVAGCREAYKQQFNPSVIGVNVARVIYSSVRDMIASVTARAPYEMAKISTLLIEPKDLSINFAKDEEEAILRTSFGITDEQLAQLRKIKAEQEAAENTKPKKKNSAKKSIRARSRY